ncbi:hypothetical protein D6D02_05177 [Aureobasidium pullulans]|uniref:Uncharacterized protein n=1 Tax=Aureobasidium pullulans TaxID=5580 RepID=A0A4V4JS56_AURPU|nr:hypothetical protein D6D20_09294 [Aureobasidium pullulans]THY12493.1 hypothetical protein D6D02_05177 [Aureobasidium pullulans]THY41335.1 hypothetical protein D6C98_09307 [Aureobasidium pullulans]
MTTKEDLVPGGRWLLQTGEGYLGALGAIAVGMAADPNLVRPLDWESYSQENNYFLGLRLVWIMLELDDDDSDMENLFECLHEIMEEWHNRYSATRRYNLFITTGDGSGSCRFLRSRTLVSSWTNVAIRYDDGLWYGCGYFAESSEDPNLQVAAQSNNVEDLTSAASDPTISEPNKTVRGTEVSINQSPEKSSKVESSNTMDDLVPGGRWIQTPGNNFESAVYALAIGMNADPKRLHPLEWNSLRAEKMSYDSLKPCCNVAFRRFDESFDPDDPLDEECLTVAVKHWNSYTKQKLQLFAETEGRITQLVMYKGDTEPTTVLVRLNGDRWEGCGYYKDEANDEYETCDTSTLLSTERVSQGVLSLIVYPGITTAPEASHNVPLPSDSENIDEKFKSELETVLELSKPLLIAISGIVPAMEKLAISLDEVKPRPRAAIPPIPETSYTGPKQPDSAFSKAPAAKKNDTRAQQSAASIQSAQEKDTSSATSYYSFDRDDSASDSD